MKMDNKSSLCQLDDLVLQEKRLSCELKKVRQEIRYARLEEAMSIYGVAVGSIVKNRDGKKHRVTAVDTRWIGSKPWLEGNPMRKDGTFGTAKRMLYSEWELEHE
jgi:hypothetical protein